MTLRSGYLAGGVVLCLAAAGSAVPIPLNRPVSGSQEGLQNEEQVWICPNDTNIIITNHRDFRTGYRQIALGRSTTNGLLWVDTLIKPQFQILNWQSDPVMTVSAAGDIIIGHLDLDTTWTLSHITFLVSHDCGLTWDGPYTVSPSPSIYPAQEDKPFVTSDRTGGSHDGSVYVSWTRFWNPLRIMFARSLDEAQTFEDTIVVGSPWSSTCFPGIYSAGSFSQPLVGKDGAVYVFWQGYHVDSIGGCDTYYAIRVNKSTDGGVTWQGDRFVVRADGYNYVDGGIDVYSQPTTDADITNGPHAGTLYLQWRDVNPNPPYDSDILFMRSLDTGHTWSASLRVNDDPVGLDVDQFHNWMICNDLGVLVSIWYDQRLDPSHYLFDVFAAYSYDGGATWTSNHRVSSVSSSPSFLRQSVDPGQSEWPLPGIESPLEPLSPMAGRIAEYIGVSSIGDIVAAVWTDTRNSSGPGQQDVYSARWRLPLTDPRLIYPLNGEEVDATPGLLWATAWKETDDRSRLQIDADQAFGSPDLDVFVTTNGYDDQLNGFLDGTYYWRIKAYKAPGGIPTDSTGFSSAGRFVLNTVVCDCGAWGDVTGDGLVNPLDVVVMVNFVYKSQDQRVQPPACSYSAGDVNCDTATNPVDVVRYVNYVYKSQTSAFCADPCGP